MGKLHETLAEERNRLFVGRDTEIANIAEWIQDKDAPTEVLFISGIGGVGKSSLMMRVLDIAAQAHQPAIWIDGRLCSKTLTGFMDVLSDNVRKLGDLSLSRSTSSSKQRIQDIFRNKALLCIDNYDSIQMIDSWLRDVFLPELPTTGVLVLLLSRQNLSESWRNDLAWRSRVKHIELLPFTRQETKEYLVRNGITESVDMKRLISDTNGLPLALAISSEKLQLVGSNTWPLSLRISAELLREVTSPELLEALDLLCIIPQATPQWLSRLLRIPLDGEKLLQLSRISFVRPTSDGFALHDVARHYLKEDMNRREPERAHSLRKHIVKELVHDIKTSDSSQRRKLTTILLSICNDVFQINSASVSPESIEQGMMVVFQQSDLPHLERMLQEQSSFAVSVEKDLIVLRALANQFPESIRVFRSQEGIPLTFCSGFYLYRETTLFHEQYFPGILERAYPDEIVKMRSQTMEHSDTFYQLLAGSREGDSDYDFWDLLGIIISGWLILYHTGLRLVMINTYGGLDEILLKLGYNMRPLTGLPDDHEYSHATVRELDWRHWDVGDRILELLHINEPEPTTPLSPIITDKAVKSALPLISSRVRLEQTELAQLLGLSGVELQIRLHKLLLDNPVFPLNERMQQVLRQMSEKADLSAELAAERLHISRATYFRVRGEAIRILKQLLLS